MFTLNSKKSDRVRHLAVTVVPWHSIWDRLTIGWLGTAAIDRGQNRHTVSHLMIGCKRQQYATLTIALVVS
jgi:hypothetical protein